MSVGVTIPINLYYLLVSLHSSLHIHFDFFSFQHFSIVAPIHFFPPPSHTHAHVLCSSTNLKSTLSSSTLQYISLAAIHNNIPYMKGKKLDEFIIFFFLLLSHSLLMVPLWWLFGFTPETAAATAVDAAAAETLYFGRNRISFCAINTDWKRQSNNEKNCWNNI